MSHHVVTFECVKVHLFCTKLGPSSICRGFVANCGREACLSPIGTAFARLSSPALEGGCRMKPPKANETTPKCFGHGLEEEHIRGWNDRPHPPHTRGTFHRRPQSLHTEKHKLSCSCFLPNTSPMQHSRSHYNAFRRITSQTCTDLRTWQHQMTTIMQPFHCDLQPQIQDTRTTHTGTTTRCRTQRRNTFAAETTAAAPAAHTRYLSLPAAATLHGKTQAFVLLLPPQHKPHATFTQPLQCVSPHHVAKPARIYAHGNTRWQQSCSHSTAICNHRVKTRIELRTQEQPLVAEHRGGTHSRLKRSAAPAAHTRYLSSPAAATLHGKTQAFVLLLPPQHKPHATFMQPITKSPLPKVTASQSHHFPSSPSSPLPSLTTSLRHNFP